MHNKCNCPDSPAAEMTSAFRNLHISEKKYRIGKAERKASKIERGFAGTRGRSIKTEDAMAARCGQVVKIEAGPIENGGRPDQDRTGRLEGRSMTTAGIV